MCDEAKSTIDSQGNAALETLPVIVPIDSISEVDFSLLQSPTFTSQYMDTQHKVTATLYQPVSNLLV